MDRSNQNQHRYLYIDLLNILAILGVVFLHHNGTVHKYRPDITWSHSLIVECLFYFSVPIFLMNSGATLLSYRAKYSTGKFFRRRLTRTWIPGLTWTVLTFLWKVYLVRTLIPQPNNILCCVINNCVEPTYYFLFLITSLYLVYPVISVLVEASQHKVLLYTVFITLCFNSLIPSLILFTDCSWNQYLQMPIGIYAVYPILGYLLSTNNLNTLNIIVIYALGVSGFVYHYSSRYLLSHKLGKTYKKTMGYHHVHAFLYSMSIFTLVKRKCARYIEFITRREKIIHAVSDCSFGVYLIHKMVMYYEIKVLSLDRRSTAWRVFFPLVTYTNCLLIVSTLHHIPIIRRLI